MMSTKKHHSKKVIKVVRKARPKFPLNVPVNVKVEGERVMRKNVVLTMHPSDPSKVNVKTGRRGRPAILSLSNIEKVRAL